MDYSNINKNNTPMAVTNDFQQQAKLAALDASIRLATSLGSVVNIDTNVLKGSDFDINKFKSVWAATGILPIQAKETTPTDNVLREASKIYKWLTTEPTVNKPNY